MTSPVDSANNVNSSQRLRPVTAATLVESVADAIRAEILAGRFAPGERLVEAELARELQVSRGPIREALALLDKDGIVYNLPRRGKYVQEFTPKLVDEIYSLRRVLEPYAVSRVIEHLDDARIARLEEAVGSLSEAAAGTDVRELAARDVAFHDLLYELSGHELLQRAWSENVAGKLRILLNVTNRTLPALTDAERQHRLLIQPILERDVPAARAAVESHIDEAWQRAHLGLAGSEPVAL